MVTLVPTMGKPKRWTVILYRSVALLESQGMDRRKDNRIMTVLPSATAGTWVSTVMPRLCTQVYSRWMSWTWFWYEEWLHLDFWYIFFDYLSCILFLTYLVQLSHLPMSVAITKWPKSSSHFEGGNLSTKVHFFWDLASLKRTVCPQKIDDLLRWYFLGVSVCFLGRFGSFQGVNTPEN